MAIEILTYTKSILIDYEDGSATMELNSEEEGELVKTLLYSNDFWASFLGSLSAAIGKHK